WITASLEGLGLEADYLATIDDAFVLDARKYLAALLVMPAQEAANYSETKLRGRAGIACPWAVISPSFSTTQRASLIAGGAAALIDKASQIGYLGDVLASLVHRSELADETAVDPEQKAKTQTSPKLSILLADDNASNRMLISRILTDAGHAVTVVERGDQAFDKMADGLLDLALLDLNLP